MDADHAVTHNTHTQTHVPAQKHIIILTQRLIVRIGAVLYPCLFVLIFNPIALFMFIVIQKDSLKTFINKVRFYMGPMTSFLRLGSELYTVCSVTDLSIVKKQTNMLCLGL